MRDGKLGILLAAGTSSSAFSPRRRSTHKTLQNQFLDLTERSKIAFVNHSSHTWRKYLPETMVGGVAMLDYNNDGLPDLFFVNGAELKDPMSASIAPR